MTTQELSVIDLNNPLYQHQFENRYSIYCHDPFEYKPVSIEKINELANQLKAQGAVIAITLKGNWYLTADSFDELQQEINEKEQIKDYLAEGWGSYLLDISSSLFYLGYPKLFWKNYQFDDRVRKEDEWGEVSYCQPINNREI